MFEYIKEQVQTVTENDPSISNPLEALLCPSFKALLYYKLSHYFYEHNHLLLARYISEKSKKKLKRNEKRKRRVPSLRIHRLPPKPGSLRASTE